MRYAILGTGYIGPVNAKALLECEDVQIAVIANRTIEKAEKLRDDLGLECPVYADWKEALHKEKPDAAVICVFNDQHKEYFMECARLGIHILVEKPLANSYQDCIEMMEAARKVKIRVSVLQTQRYGAVLHTAKQYILAHADELGQLCQITDEMSCHYFWKGRSPWHLDDGRSGGGIVLNYGVHQIDRVRFFLGEETAEFHACYQKKKEGIDTYSSYAMMGVGDRGTPYTISCLGYCGPSINTLTMYYQKKTIRCELVDNGIVSKGVYIGDTRMGRFERIELLCEDGEDAHQMYVREMKDASAYLSGKMNEAPISMEWAAENVRLCEAGM